MSGIGQRKRGRFSRVVSAILITSLALWALAAAALACPPPSDPPARPDDLVGDATTPSNGQACVSIEPNRGYEPRGWDLVVTMGRKRAMNGAQKPGELLAITFYLTSPSRRLERGQIAVHRLEGGAPYGHCGVWGIRRSQQKDEAAAVFVFGAGGNQIF